MSFRICSDILSFRDGQLYDLPLVFPTYVELFGPGRMSLRHKDHGVGRTECDEVKRDPRNNIRKSTVSLDLNSQSFIKECSSEETKNQVSTSLNTILLNVPFNTFRFHYCRPFYYYLSGVQFPSLTFSFTPLQSGRVRCYLHGWLL